MTTTTLTLTDFLLARISEAEKAARDDGADAMVGWCLKELSKSAYEWVQAYMLRVARRTLAECEAKRQILRICEYGSFHNSEVHRMASKPILRALALPYADHPDYRGEWRP